MTPSLPRFDIADVLLIYAVLGSDDVLVARVGSYRPHLIVSQLSARMSHTKRLIRSTFPFFVGTIVVMCSEKKVGWIDAWRNIAVMTYQQTIWNRSISKLPRNSMNHNLLVSDTDSPVTSAIRSTEPYQATAHRDRRTLCFQKMRQLLYFVRHETSTKVVVPLAVLWHGRVMNPFAATRRVA